ncbi:hypothetical protein KI387_021493, partial [Taxus chinensis]
GFGYVVPQIDDLLDEENSDISELVEGSLGLQSPIVYASDHSVYPLPIPGSEVLGSSVDRLVWGMGSSCLKTQERGTVRTAIISKIELGGSAFKIRDVNGMLTDGGGVLTVGVAPHAIRVGYSGTTYLSTSYLNSYGMTLINPDFGTVVC